MRSGEKRPRLLKKGVCLFLMCAVFAGACAAYAQEPAGSGPSQEPVAAETRTEEPEAPAGPELAGFKTSGFAASPDAPKDETDDIDQLGLSIPEFWYVNAAGEAAAVLKKDGIFDLSGVKAEDIRGLRLRLDFSILKNADERSVAPGDTFRFEFPAAFTVGDTAGPKEMTGGGQVVATYEIRDGVLTATFGEIVGNPGAMDITGGCLLDFMLENGVLSQGSTTSVGIPLQKTPSGDTGVEVLFPKVSVPDGVEKTGEYDPQTGRVAWTVKVGTKTPGASLAGYKVTDTAGEGQSFVSAEIEKNGAYELLADFAAEGFSYTFGADDKAPQTLRVVTQVTKDVFTAAGQAALPRVANTAELSNGTAAPPQDAEWTAVGEVTVPMGRIDKTGEQVSANKMGWTITVNDNPTPNTILGAVIRDTLSADLKLDEASPTLKIGSGKAIKLPVNPTPLPGTPYATLDSDNHFVVYLGDINGKYTLHFETLVENGVGTGASPTLENSASLEGRLPFGDGDEPYVVQGRVGPVSSAFNTVHVAKTAGAFNYAAGELRWSIKPSARMERYDQAVVADRIPDDQEFVEGSAVIRNAARPEGAQELTPEEVKGILGVNGKEITFTFGAAEDTAEDYIDNITIEYRTRALNYFSENGIAHKYSNSASLSVTAGETSYGATDTADKWIANHILAKTAAYEFDDGENRGYMHYAVTVNGDGTNLGGVTVSDDLAGYNEATRINDLAGNDITDEFPMPDWEFAAEKFRVENVTDGIDSMQGYGIGEGKTTFENGLLHVPLGELQKKYRIHIYMELKNKDAFLARNVKIITGNTATAAADEFTCPQKTFSVSAAQPAAQDAFANKLIDKKSLGYDGDGIPANILWEVRFNPNGAALGYCAVEDTVPAGMEFDYDSVELYVSAHTGGTVTGTGAKVPKTGYRVDVAAHADGSSTMKVTPPQDGRAYTLRYRTNITGTLTDMNVKNDAALLSGGSPLAEDYALQMAGENAWANLTWKAAHQIYKYDADAGEAVPVPGAVYGLFPRGGAGGVPLKTGITDSEGKIMFWGLEQNTAYDIREITAPDGYVCDPEVYTFTTSADTYDPSRVASQPVPERRTAATVQIRKASKEDPSAGIGGTVFALYRTMDGAVPDGVPVEFSGSAGVYTYVGCGVDGTGLYTGEDGRLILDGLPWDEYFLCETHAAAGYLADIGRRYAITVNPAGSASFDSASGISAVGTVLNDPTKVEVLKTDETGQLLPGARLSLEDARGNVVETWVSGTEAKTFTGRLEAGASYTVRELSPPAGYEAAQPISFSVKTDGALQSVLVINNRQPGQNGGTAEDPGQAPPRGGEGIREAGKNTRAPQTGDAEATPLPLLAALSASAAGWALHSLRKGKRFS